MVNSTKSTSKTCQLCGKAELVRFEIPNSSVLWLCNDCELYQAGEMVEESAYEGNYHVGYAKHRAQKLRTARLRLNRIASLIGKKDRLTEGKENRKQPKLLEIGCSVGCTLEAAQQIGWQAIGVDVSRDAVSICRQHGFDANHVDALKLPFENDCVDVVCAWHVIEHVEDVTKTIKEWGRVLKPGGILALETPDASCPKVRRMGEKYRKFWAPEHTYTFTPWNLGQFLSRAGFEIVHAPRIGSFSQLGIQLGSYAVVYNTYHSVRKLVGIEKAFQIFARKKEPMKNATSYSRVA